MLKKIKEFFEKLFKKENSKYIEAPKNEEIQKNFKEQIVDERERRALKLQQDFRAGTIKEEELLEEDFDLLYELYIKQIDETKKSIQEYKDKIIAIRTKLA